VKNNIRPTLRFALTTINSREYTDILLIYAAEVVERKFMKQA